MRTLEEILNDAILAMGVAVSVFPAEAAPIALIAKFIQIAQAAAAAHQAASGKPLDMATLHQIKPMP